MRMNKVSFTDYCNKNDINFKQIKLFRAYVDNYYNMFEIDKNNEFEERTKKEEIGDFNREWLYIGRHNVVEIYSCLGLHDELEVIKDYNTEYEWYDTFYDFKKFYENKELQGIIKENDINFLLFMFLLIEYKPVDSKISKYFIENIEEGIYKYGLAKLHRVYESTLEEKVFVAMCFHKELNRVRKSIEEAIKVCGYTPVLIDEKEHNNQIVPEIHKEIADSKFVVADLTKNRGGVYYEAGYAFSKGKPLILTCKNNGHVHFDLAQVNTIFWKDENDLKERLIKRIKATIDVEF